MPNLPGLPEAITGAITAAIGVKAEQMLSGDTVPSYTPVRYKGVTLNTEMEQEFKKLAEYRQNKEMPNAAGATGGGTVATIEVKGQKVYGHNTTLEREYLNKDTFAQRKQLFDELQATGYINSNLKYNDKRVNFIYHAETQAILEAKQKLGSLEGEELVIYVDREPCGFCYNHLPKVAELYGIKSITIISSNPDQESQIVTITKDGVK